LSAKAAAQVNEMNAKVKEGLKPDEELGPRASTASTEAVAPATPAPNLSQLKSDNVSKEDLLEILPKMNRKVKALTTLRQQLTDKVESAESEKARLKALLVDEILNG